MNIHPFHPQYNIQDSLQNTPKLYSPSYTKTNQTLYSSFLKSNNIQMVQNENHSQETIKNSSPNSYNKELKKQQVKQNQFGPYMIIDNIKWNNDQSFFTSNMELNIQYTVLKQLDENILWRINYLGSAYSQKHDQVMIQFETEENDNSSSFPEKRQFKLTIQPPKWNLISGQELFKIGAITISAFYKEQQFVKIGYYIHYQEPTLSQNEKIYVSRLNKQKIKEEKKQDKIKNFFKKKKSIKKSPKTILQESNDFNQESQRKIIQGVLKRTIRTILADKPRVTKFQIDWQKQEQNQKSIKLQIDGESTDILQNQHLITQYMKPTQAKPFQEILQ